MCMRRDATHVRIALRRRAGRALRGETALAGLRTMVERRRSRGRSAAQAFMAVASSMAMEMRMCEELKEKGQRLYIHRANRSIARLGSGYALVVVTYDHGDTPVVRGAL